MVWISIILAIIEAIPGIIKLIQEIVDLLKGHPHHQHAFFGILLAWKDHKDPVKLEADLKALHTSIKHA